MGFFIFLFYLFAELYFSLFLIDRYSFLDFLLYSVSSFFLGIVLMSLIGRGVLQSLQSDLTKGSLPERAILNRGLLFFGAFLVFLPGVLNDLLAVMCILPGTRHLLAYFLTKSLVKRMGTGGSFTFVRFGGAGGPVFTQASRTEREARVVEVEPLSVEHSKSSQSSD